MTRLLSLNSLVFLFIFTKIYSSSLNTEVQYGQRVASMSISLQQYGHFFVVGGFGSSSASKRPIMFTLFISLTSRNIINAMIIKSITVVINAPYLSSTFPTCSIKLSKFIPPNNPRSGDIISPTSDETIF